MLNVYSLRLGADVHKDAPILYVGQDRKYYFLFLRKVRMFMIRPPKDISSDKIILTHRTYTFNKLYPNLLLKTAKNLSV